MHLTPLQGNIVEKVLRDRSGRLALVTFYIYEHAGRAKARIVNVAFLEETIADTKTIALPGGTRRNSVVSEISFKREIVSPYFDTNILFTSGSKPRAPSRY